MAESSFDSSVSRCYGCLSSIGERNLQTYYIKKLIFRTILQMDKLLLCYICKRVAVQTEKFVHNVETSQALFADSKNEMAYSPENYKTLIHPLINLTCSSKSEDQIVINNHELDEQLFIKDECEVGDITGHFTMIPGEIEIKKEEQNQDLGNDFEAVNIDEPTNYDSSEHAVDNITELTRTGPNDVGEASRQADMKQPKKDFNDYCAGVVTLTKEELKEERERKATETKYLEATFKCADCIKMFVMKTPYENHMKLHDKERGKFECDVCKQRLKTKCQLENHCRYHFDRYQCSVCPTRRNCEASLKDHYLRTHSDGRYHYSCPVCFKQFKFRSSLQKHKADKHEARARISCKYCDRTFASESAIGYHLKFNHTAEEAATLKPHTCPECGRTFKMLQKLNNHMVSHTSRRDHYCVECDKSFKTRTALNQHFKTVVAHNLDKVGGPQENISYPCPQCEKQFPQKKALTRHVNNMHLNRNLLQCSQCGKTFRSKKRLTIHILSHEDEFERHKKHCCTVCNKRFYEKGVLAKHMNIHTGEKPFQCGHCPAQFAHSGSRYNHVRLVHLNLTRRGAPKGAQPRKQRL